ncbi:MAG TPA: 4-hydroxybenzoate octaprenyltransferase [Bauldia sp.]|nr:4-hydroxybenzoate octaprenyltransferase [Bauldia sp.]
MDAPRPPDTPDSLGSHPILRFLPAALVPYSRLARLDRPIGWWLLLWPCWWSSALAADAAGLRYPDPWHLVLFLVGAVVMRGAGCTYNDIVDRDIDAAVARTRARPIPSGQVSVGEAKAFLVAQALAGLAVLLCFNRTTILIGAASLLSVAVYPFLKRVTWWPQIGLGIAFSWGALLGWPALFGDLGWPAVVLYQGCILWTVGYDTIYAHQDKEDDALVGVHSTARLFGTRTPLALTLLYAASTVTLALAFWLTGVGLWAWGGLAIGGVQLGWQVVKTDFDDPASCLRSFRSNRGYGWIVFLGLVADCALRGL